MKWRIKYIRWYVTTMLLPRKPLIFTLSKSTYEKKCRLRKRIYKQIQRLREISNERSRKQKAKLHELHE